MNEMIDKMEQRVKDLEAGIQQSAANHNAILGRLEESKVMLAMCKESVLNLDAVIEAACGDVCN